MYRQPSRNHRSIHKGGIKLKNVFQVCLLLAICIWLLYQMKHSRDKKKEYEDQYSNASYKIHDGESETSRFGRKDLPNTVVTSIKSETEVPDDDKDEVEGDVHEEQRSLGDHKMDGQGEEKTIEEIKKKEQVALIEGKKSYVEEHEHEEASHEAREKSFKGDDASSEVLHSAQATPEHEDGHETVEVSHATNKTEHEEGSNNEHNAQDVEHEEGPHEARERSFKGDDVSSAVDHKPVKDSELEIEEVRGVDEKISENAKKEEKEIEELHDQTNPDPEVKNDNASANELLDSFVENNSSFIHDKTETQLNEDSPIEASPENKELEVAITDIYNSQTLSNKTISESRTETEEQFDQKSVSTIDNQKELQVYSPNNSSDILYNSPSDFSKNEENLQINVTTGSHNKLETQSEEKQVVNPTTNDAPEQNETTASSQPHELYNEVKIEAPHDEKSGLQQVATEQILHSELVAPQEKPEENHNSSSATTTNNTAKEVPLDFNDSNNSLHNDTAGEVTHGETDSSTSAGIQNEVKRGTEEAAQ